MSEDGGSREDRREGRQRVRKIFRHRWTQMNTDKKSICIYLCSSVSICGEKCLCMSFASAFAASPILERQKVFVLATNVAGRRIRNPPSVVASCTWGRGPFVRLRCRGQDSPNSVGGAFARRANLLGG